MKRQLFFLIFSIIICIGCNNKNNYSHSKFYDYIVVNQLSSQIVKIVPKDKTDFWLTTSDTIFVYPQTHSIIGSTGKNDDNRKIVDYYKPNDTIEKFEVFIGNIKQEKNFTQRLNWTFTYGSVDESAFYTLTLNQTNIILK